MTDEIDRAPITTRLAEGLEVLRLGAQRVMAEALARLPAEHRQRIQRAVDADQCALTVQIDLPAYEVRVLADGTGWAQPQCLFAIERPPASENDPPIAS